jgi:hypothetical protein
MMIISLYLRLIFLSVLLTHVSVYAYPSFFTSFPLAEYIEHPWSTTMGIISSIVFGGTEFSDARLVVIVLVTGDEKQTQGDALQVLSEQMRLYGAEFYLQHYDPLASTLEPVLR